MPEWINSFSQVLCLGWGFLLHKIHFPVGYFLACILAVVMCHWECNCISVTPLIMPPETPVLLRSHIAIKNYKEFPERSIWSGPICNNVACLHRGRHGLWAPGKATLSLTLTFITKTCQWLWFELDVKIKILKSRNLVKVIMDKHFWIAIWRNFLIKLQNLFPWAWHSANYEVIGGWQRDL